MTRLINISDTDFIVQAQTGTTKDSFDAVPFIKIKLAKRGAKGVKMRV